MFSFKRASQLNTLYTCTQAHAQQRCYKLRDGIKKHPVKSYTGDFGGIHRGVQWLTGHDRGDSGTHGVCTKADRGLQGVHGLTLGAQSGDDRENTGGDRGRHFHTDRFFLEPVVDCISIFLSE